MVKIPTRDCKDICYSIRECVTVGVTQFLKWRPINEKQSVPQLKLTWQLLSCLNGGFSRY